jgi:aminopeptidase N
VRRGARAVCLLFAWLAAAGAPVCGSPHYAMHVDVDYEAASFTGDLRVEYVNTTGIELGELFFRLYPNGAGIYGDASLRVTETSVEGRAVEAETFVEDTVLYVPLPEPLRPDARVAVTIAFEGTAEDWFRAERSPSAYGLLTRSENALTLTAFYPIPAGLTAATSGTLDDAIEEEGSATYRYTIEGARDFSVVLLDGHERSEAVVGDVTLNAWFTPEKGQAAGITLERAADAMTLFGDLFGPPPYDEVDLVEVPLRRAAGVEFSGLILVSSDYAEDPSDAFYDVIVSHEMAHQWFYAGVGNDVIEDPWLDESFATYLSYLFLDAFAGPGVASGTLDSWERTYDRARAGAPDATVAAPLYAFSQSSTYTAFVYSGGAILLDTIRREIGDEAFFAAVGAYYADHLGRLATPSDLLAAFEASCDCRLDDLVRDFGLRR